jgi:Ca2+-binding RTX toxin-like protein
MVKGDVVMGLIPFLMLMLVAAIPFSLRDDQPEDDTEPPPDDDRIRGTDGDDIIDAEDEPADILGFAGDDTITATGASTVSGGAGDDIIRGSGESTLYGGAGDDRIAGNLFGSTLDGGTGNDVIDAAPAAVITTGSGSDTVWVDASYPVTGDIYNAGTAVVSDYVAGQDYYGIYGSVGFDPADEQPVAGDLTFTETDDGVHVEIGGVPIFLLQGVRAADVAADDFVLEERFQPENGVIEGTERDDIIVGEGLTVHGYAGRDMISGGEGAVVRGGRGDDMLFGAADGAVGASFFGGELDDVFRGNLDGAFVYGGSGDDIIFAGSGTIVATGSGADVVLVDALLPVQGVDLPLGPPVVTDYTAGADIYQVTGTVFTDPATGMPNEPELSFFEGADGIAVQVDGGAGAATVILLTGVTLEEIDPQDFQLVA